MYSMLQVFRNTAVYREKNVSNEYQIFLSKAETLSSRY